MTPIDDEAQQSYRRAAVTNTVAWEGLTQELRFLEAQPRQQGHRVLTIEAELQQLHNTFSRLAPPAALMGQHVRQLQLQVAQLQALRAAREPEA
jgi:hypothetical protein